MNTANPKDKRTNSIEYPPKSGIRIREIPNTTNGVQFGSSFIATIPVKVTGAKRERKQFLILREAKEWAENQLHTGRTLGGAFHKLTEREQRLCVDALALLRPKGISILKAAQFAVERLAPEVCAKTAAEVVAELIENQQSAKASKRYVADLRSRLTRFAGKFTCPLSHITSTEIGDWIGSLELAPQSQTNFRRVIVTLFQYAKDRDYLPRSFDEHERVKVAKVKGDGEIVIFNASEVARLLAAATPDFLPSLAIAAFAGLRSAEIERLDWSEIRLAERNIVLGSSKAKTRSRRIIPIADNLAAWLAGHVKESGLVWQGTHDGFSKAQQQTAKAAGLAWKQNGLRHAYVSHRMAIVKDAAKVSLEAGNSPGMVFKHYRELVSESDARKYFSIEPKTAANITPMSSAVA